MNRLLNTIWLLLLCPVLMLGQGLQRYEYWVDEDYSQHKTVNSNSAEITLSIDVGNQQIGLHYLNFRAQNTDGEWGSVNRYLYYIPEPPATVAPLKGYEYWLDDQTANKLYVNSTSESVLLNVDVSQLSVGVHYINFRSQNSREEWGMVNRYLFYVPELADPTAGISQYEYWIDDDYSKAQRVTTSETNMLVSMDISQLPVGVHYYNFRAKNTQGEWGNISRLLFYVPDEPDDSQGSPLVGYTYNFNQQATYVGIGEQTYYELKDNVITIPDLVEIGNLVTGCTFTFNADGNFAHLERTQLVSFALQFKKKSGAVSVPAATQFTMSDALDRAIKPLSIKESATWEKVPMGDFGAFRIDAIDQLDAHLNVSQQCGVWLYDANGNRINSYQQIAGGESVSLNLSAGTYYGIVYSMVKDEQNTDSQLILSLTVSKVEKFVDNSDDLQDFIDGLGDNKGTEDAPIEIPVGENGLTIDKDVAIDDLQLFINGGGDVNTKIPVYFAGGVLNLSKPQSCVCGKNVRLSNVSSQAPEITRAVSSSSGGISNNGKLVFEETLFESGSYVIENHSGATLQLKENTVVSNNRSSLIVNGGNVYLDGTVMVGSLQNISGGRVYLTSSLAKDVYIAIAESSDVEPGVAIVAGADGYSLTEADVSHIHLSLPAGYEYTYDAATGGLVVSSMNGIADVRTSQPVVVESYDVAGQRVKAGQKGLIIQRMSDGTIKKHF